MTTKRAKVSLYVTKTSQNGIAFIVDRTDRTDDTPPEFPLGNADPYVDQAYRTDDCS